MKKIINLGSAGQGINWLAESNIEEGLIDTSVKSVYPRRGKIKRKCFQFRVKAKDLHVAQAYLLQSLENLQYWKIAYLA